MAASTVGTHRLQEFVRLHRMGRCAREVCRLLRMGRTTEWRYRKVFQDAGVLQSAANELPAVEVLKAASRAVVAAAAAQQEIPSASPGATRSSRCLERGGSGRAAGGLLEAVVGAIDLGRVEAADDAQRGIDHQARLDFASVRSAPASTVPRLRPRSATSISIFLGES